MLQGNVATVLGCRLEIHLSSIQVLYERENTSHQPGSHADFFFILLQIILNEYL